MGCEERVVSSEVGVKVPVVDVGDGRVGRLVVCREVPVLELGVGDRILTKRGPRRVMEKNVVYGGLEVWLELEHRREGERTLKLKVTEVVYRV